MKLLAQIGTISPPPSVPNVGPGDPSSFIAGIIRAGIQLLIIVSFILALLWTIFAGYRFITSAGDTKATGQAWTQLYWGLIGMVVVLGSFAIIKLVETFFNVPIITNGLELPHR